MKEIPVSRLLSTITARRLLNAGRALAGFLTSAATKRTFVWGRPFIMTVEPTNLCNLKCPLCVTGNGKMTRRAGKMTLATFKQAIDSAGDFLFYLLLYQQGEPFLNDDVLEFVRYAKRKRIFVTTSSNGHYFGEETAKGTVASGLDSLIISVDGATQTGYETYRVGGELSKVKNGIRNLVAEKKRQGSKTPFIYLQFITMRHNEGELKAMREMAARLGVDKLLVKSVQVETAEEAERWLPENESLRRYWLKDGNLRPKRAGKGPCPRPWTSTLVNWNGEVVPCCFDKNASHPTGNLTKSEALTTVWKSKDYAEFRNQMLANRDAIDICSNCSQGLRLYR